jgi:hypothetical protein
MGTSLLGPFLFGCCVGVWSRRSFGFWLGIRDASWLTVARTLVSLNDIMSSAFAVAPAGVAVYDLRKRRVPGSD